MKKFDYSEADAVFVKGDRSHTNVQWEQGDALLKLFGKPTDAPTDKAGSKFTEYSEHLKGLGLDYEPLSLKNLRFAAHRFPPKERRAGVGWHIHYLAQDPTTLQSIIDVLPRNKKLTQTFVLEVLRGRALKRQEELEAEMERRRALAADYKREREKAEEEARGANSIASRKAAEARAEAAARLQRANLTPLKPKDLPPTDIKAEDMPLMITRAAFLRDLTQLQLQMSNLQRDYGELIPTFPDSAAEHAHDELMKLADAARKFAVMWKSHTGKSSHLTVVANVG